MSQATGIKEENFQQELSIIGNQEVTVGEVLIDLIVNSRTGNDVAALAQDANYSSAIDSIAKFL